MKYLVFSKVTGQILSKINCINPAEFDTVDTLVIEDPGIDVADTYIDIVTNGLVQRPLRPSDNHQFDYATKQWIDPRTLDDVKALKRSEIIKARNAAITSGFTYMGKIIDSDRDSVMAITNAAVAALSAKAAGIQYSVTWTCADDTTLLLDADGVLGMSVALAMYADAQHTKGRPLKTAIKNATKIVDAEAIKW